MSTAVEEPVTSTRYTVAVKAIADEIAAKLEADGVTGAAAWERAEAALRRHRASGPHRWLFEGVETIIASPSAFEALEVGKDGSRDWVQGSVASAAEAVVKFDVFRRLSDHPALEVE
jgi:hypothetical protein